MDQILTQGSEGAKDDLNGQGAVPFCASVSQSLNSKGMDSDLYRKQAYKQTEIIRVVKMPKNIYAQLKIEFYLLIIIYLIYLFKLTQILHNNIIVVKYLS